MKTIGLKSAIALAIASYSSLSLANGIAINEQSASGMGTSFAGRSSSALDASTVFGNPAGMSKLERTEVTGGVAVIDASTDYSDAQSSATGTNKGDMVPTSAIPFGYVVTPLNEDWHFGLGIYVPYAVISDYEKSFQGRYHGLYSKVEVITVQPTLSYKINDKVSIGFGPTFNRIEGKLTNNLSLAALGGGDAKLNIKGDDVAVGYNIGVLADVTDQLAVGVTYHSKVKYELEGHTKVTGVSSASPVVNSLISPLNGSYDASLDLTTPESLDASFTYKLDDRWTLYGGATWTRWSRLEAIVVENSGTPTIPGLGNVTGTVDEELQWHDTWSYAIGAAYQLNPQWVLRTGFALDPSPTDNEYRNVRIPVGNRKTVSIGAGWSPTPDMTVDVAYAYLWESESSINREGNTLQPAYNANVKNSAHGIAAQLSYRF
ncbi:long-chain fatty acid transport protein [Pseudomonas duriflava]|uniref:Long-chain fatty acid transport protein n=1 Tax=Pseudomonas duriflava TaxID=459528 RepID=A0A562QAH5_9PSED|nr:outer membrane protein transport protein [Pseudomonas duriflava]TWI53748.1 long-chain fatty acid transport protein [Pseudomonas duriflava]